MHSDDDEINSDSASSEFRSVRGPTIPEVVADRLRDAILAGKYTRGERLVEQKLAALFGIGQPTVREALRELELQGFVRKRGNRGTYVSQFSEDDIQKQLEVRIALETVAMEKAASEVTQEEAVLLEALIQQMETAVDNNDRVTCHKLDMMFHRRIWNCAGNEYLSLILERVTFSLSAFLLLEQTPGDPGTGSIVRQHRDILNALMTRNPGLAREKFLATMDSVMKLHHRAHAAG
jgi:DNA-binding GntR family transcriptional regulator